MATATDASRERSLIEKLEFRIAAADTSEKLQAILLKFLPALLQKLASEDTYNRNLTIKVCQYIRQRLQIDTTIQLPVDALSRTFRETTNTFVKQFTLLFVQQGLARLPRKDALTALPVVLQSSIQDGQLDLNGKRMFIAAIDLLLSALVDWKLPEHDSPEDQVLASHFQMTTTQADVIAQVLASFLLFNPKSSQTATDPDDLDSTFSKHYVHRSLIAPNLASFLFTSVFTDVQRFAPAIILSVDANTAANSRADTMFKQCHFDLEDPTYVEKAFNVYNAGNARLKTKVLTLLLRSETSTKDTARLLSLVQTQLEETVSNLEASKLRNATFSYLVWAVRVNPEISTIATELLDSLKASVELQGWPEPQKLSQTETELRSQAYECIGLLCAPLAETVYKSTSESHNSGRQTLIFEIVSWLFTSLRCETSRDIRHSIEDSLSRLMTSVTPTDANELASYKALLLFSATAREGDADAIYHVATRNNVQYPAVRFVNRVLPFEDVEARIIDLLALASERKEVAEEAARGLDPNWYRMNLKLSNNTSGQLVNVPSFEAFAKVLFGDGNLSLKSSSILSQKECLAGAATFSKQLIASEAWNGTSSDVQSETDWQTMVNAKLDNDIHARGQFKDFLRTKPRELVGALLQMCYRGMATGSPECALAAFQISSLSTDSILQGVSPAGIADLETAMQSMNHERYLACRIMGMISSISPANIASAKSKIAELTQWRSAVGQSHVRLVSSLLTLAFTLGRAHLRQPSSTVYSNGLELWNICHEMLNSTNKGSASAAATAIGQMALCGLKGDVALSCDSLDILLVHAKKEDETAVTAAGRVLHAVWSELITERKPDILGKIYALHEVRRAEFHFALGEALAASALQFQSSSTLTEFDIDGEVPVDIYADLFDTFLTDILEKCKSTKPSLRRASSIWLLSLVQFCRLDDLLLARLPEIQAVFLRLLTDRDDIVQEVGSKGLGIVYEKGNRTLREDLVRELVQSFTGSSVKTAGTVTEETQLFEEGALPTEKGQSVSTYKDIVSLAQEMGDPSLVYRFMNLAANNAIWSSRAAFGRFGLSTVLADSDYLQKNKKFYPKLYRYRFDPNPNVQRAMDDIWKALVKDSNAVIAENFDIIMDDLLHSIVYGREWRGREASCAAISELIQDRDVSTFAKYLDEIWKVAFKVLDDVKESVRGAAMKLCRTLTNMLIRNLEVGEGSSARAKVMFSHAMPFLIQQMEGGAGKDVQQYAVVTLLEIIKKAPPSSLHSYAPTLLDVLISSLSSLEHESINYLHLNADKYGLTAEKLDSMRVSSIGASPVSEAIDKCLDSLSVGNLIDENDQSSSNGQKQLSSTEDAMRRIERCFKTTIGLPSRVGLSRVIITLVTRHSLMFRPYSDKFARITRKNLLDRNATISQSFSTALAYLLRLATEKEVHATIQHVQKLYFESQETSHRAVAGEVVLATSKASNDVFKRFSAALLPFAFVGKQDRDEDTRSRFDEAWKENVAGSRSLQLYLHEIIQLISEHIKSSLWPIRHACCFAVAEFVSSGDKTISYTKKEAQSVWPLVEESLAGKTWEGKEKVVTALPDFVTRAGAIWSDVRAQVKKIALREAKRNNVEYSPHALRALGALARQHPDLDASSEIIPYLVEVVDRVLDKDKDAMDIDQPSKSNSSDILDDQLLCSTATCLFANLHLGTNSDILEQSAKLARRIRDGLPSTTLLLALYEAADECVKSIIEEVQIDASGENVVMRDISCSDPIGAGTTIFHNLALALFEADASSQSSAAADASESLRLIRVKLVLGMIAKEALIDNTTRALLDKTLTLWKAHETSISVNEILDKAIRMSKGTA